MQYYKEEEEGHTQGGEALKNQSSVLGADILEIARNANEVGCEKTEKFPLGCRERCTLVLKTIPQAPGFKFAASMERPFHPKLPNHLSTLSFPPTAQYPMTNIFTEVIMYTQCDACSHA